MTETEKIYHTTVHLGLIVHDIHTIAYHAVAGRRNACWESWVLMCFMNKRLLEQEHAEERNMFYRLHQNAI